MNMKKFAKSMLGVTLLEIMLVLAIAAMIIVMSVRYYQSATSNQQANAVLQMVQGITAAADGLAQSTGGYSQATTVSIGPLMPNSSLRTPWGGDITITPGSGTSPSTYKVNIAGTPQAVCALLTSRLKANIKYTDIKPATCSKTPNAIEYTYDAQK